LRTASLLFFHPEEVRVATNKFAPTLACLVFLFALAGSAAEGQEKVIHRFSGQPSDGDFPVGDLIADSKGKRSHLRGRNVQ